MIADSDDLNFHPRISRALLEWYIRRMFISFKKNDSCLSNLPNILANRVGRFLLGALKPLSFNTLAISGKNI